MSALTKNSFDVFENPRTTSSSTTYSYILKTGWLLWSCATLFYFYQFILRVCTGVMAQDIMLDLGLSGSDFGIIAGAYYISYALMQIPHGLMSDKYDLKIILLGSILIAVLGTFLLSQSTSLFTLYLSRILIGLGSSAAFLSCLKSITLWFPHSYLAVLTGITVTVGTLGANIGGKPLAMSVEHFGWRTTVLALAILGLIIFIIAALFVFNGKSINVNSKPIKKDNKTPLRKSNCYSNTDPVSLKTSLKQIFSSYQIWLVGILYFLFYTPLSCLADTWGVSYLSKVHQLTPVDAAEICLRIYIGVALGTPFIGALSNKIKSRRKPIIFCAFASTLLFAAIFYLPALSLLHIKIMFFALGFLLGGLKLVFTIVCELTPKKMNGMAIGFINFSCMLNGLVLPYIIGKSLDTYKTSAHTALDHLTLSQHYASAFLIPTSCLFFAFIIALFVKESYRWEKSE